MLKCCGTCGRWRKSNNPVYCKQGKCPIYEDRWPEQKPASWCWMQVDPEELASRIKLGLVVLDETA